LQKQNFFFVEKIPLTNEPELFETILKNQNILIERIVSSGQITLPGEWLVQEKTSGVILLKGKSVLEFPENQKLELTEGDALLIPAGKKHRVIFTSSEPHCIWLAVHGKLT